MLQGMIRLAHRPLVARQLQPALAAHTARPGRLTDPEFQSRDVPGRRGALPGVPYVTILTDLADYPPNFWIEAGQAQHLVCGTPKPSPRHALRAFRSHASTRLPA